MSSAIRHSFCYNLINRLEFYLTTLNLQEQQNILNLAKLYFLFSGTSCGCADPKLCPELCTGPLQCTTDCTSGTCQEECTGCTCEDGLYRVEGECVKSKLNLNP